MHSIVMWFNCCGLLPSRYSRSGGALLWSLANLPIKSRGIKTRGNMFAHLTADGRLLGFDPGDWSILSFRIGRGRSNRPDCHSTKSSKTPDVRSRAQTLLSLGLIV
jgi:hypothetical protein